MKAIFSNLAENSDRNAHLLPIAEVAAKLGVPLDALEFHGRHAAKLPLDLIDPAKVAAGNLVLVSAVTPTPKGEGKTTISIGLTDALNRLGHRTVAVLRQPSLGPVFGRKGGASGGGQAQIVPWELINLHLTGDFNAVEKAHNLLAAMIDNNVQNRRNTLGIDPRTVAWKRVLDMNDRALRHIVVGLGGRSHGVPRETGFDITAASEVMAALCLSENLSHLREKLGGIFVGHTHDRRPIFARDLKAHGAMAALLHEAIRPNLVQTRGGSAAILHGGPFANIAQGTNSILATRMGLTFGEFAVTEAGFGFDLGGEKFFNLKCGYGKLSPRVVVLVATVRALKYHGGAALADLGNSNLPALEKGFANLARHIQSVRVFGREPVVAVNQFTTDTPEELQRVVSLCADHGVSAAVANVWKSGGAGAEDLAALVARAAAAGGTPHRPLYDWNWGVERKIEAIARNIYGADGIELLPGARASLQRIADLGCDKLPICMAKTQNSLSDNPALLGRPEGFVIRVREIEIAAGAGFLVPITGDIVRMPGLPEIPAAEHLDVDAQGRVTGWEG